MQAQQHLRAFHIKKKNQLPMLLGCTQKTQHCGQKQIIFEKLNIKTGKSEILFKSWEALAERALLAIKWHMDKGKPYWHWVVYVRENNTEYVLDSSKRIKHNKRTDFGRIKPKWYIKVNA